MCWPLPHTGTMAQADYIGRTSHVKFNFLVYCILTALTSALQESLIDPSLDVISILGKLPLPSSFSPFDPPSFVVFSNAK